MIILIDVVFVAATAEVGVAVGCTAAAGWATGAGGEGCGVTVTLVDVVGLL